MRVHSDLWTWLSSGRNTGRPWLISTGSSNSLMPTEWLVQSPLPHGIFPIQSETFRNRPPKLSRVTYERGRLRERRPCWVKIFPRQVPHVLNVLFIFKSNPVLPIEKFPSLVLPRNTIMLLLLLITHYLSSDRSRDVKNKRIEKHQRYLSWQKKPM